MSATPGKMQVLGLTEAGSEKVFVLRFLQARNHDWVGRPIFAKYNPRASWLDDLEPAFGEAKFFYDPELRQMLQEAGSPWARADESVPLVSAT